jgi:hypothetical protein
MAGLPMIGFVSKGDEKFSDRFFVITGPVRFIALLEVVICGFRSGLFYPLYGL